MEYFWQNVGSQNVLLKGGPNFEMFKMIERLCKTSTSRLKDKCLWEMFSFSFEVFLMHEAPILRAIQILNATLSRNFS